MPETVITHKRLSIGDIVNILKKGAEMSRQKRETKEIDGPFERGNELVWLVYTQDEGSVEL